MILKRFLILLLVILIIVMLSASCTNEVLPQPLQMFWGIDAAVQGFEGLEREPEGLEVESLDENTLQVAWRVGENYILPICATADEELEGVRYLGSGIPQSFEVEWLEPWAGEWYPLHEIPADMINVDIMQEDNFYTIDFGPPEGAEFREGMFRVIWFLITPTEEGLFSFNIYGYLMDVEEAFLHEPVSNILNLQAEVIE